jgi:hypothetical protein
MELTPERWARIMAMFDRIHSLPPGRRADALSSESRDDAAIASEVASLLAASESTDTPLDHPALDDLR